MPNAHIIALSVPAALTASVLAGPVPGMGYEPGFLPAVGFEDIAVGSSVSAIDFGEVRASVTHTGHHNKIHRLHDGYGATQTAGENLWKLAGGTTTFDFGGAELESFSFWYTDLEWTTLRMTFGEQVVDLRDSNSRRPEFFEFNAAPGEAFGEVTFAWVGKQNDGIGFDQMRASLASVPAPGAVALFGLTACALGRRGRRGD